MKNKMLVIMVDGFSNEYLKHTKFLKNFSKGNYAKLKPAFGYEPGFVSFFTGKKPSTTGIWNMFYFNKRSSIYSWIKPVQGLLKVLDKIKFLNKLTRYGVSIFSLLKSRSSYLQTIHRIPYEDLPFADLALKQYITEKNAVPNATSIYDILRKHKKKFIEIHGNMIHTDKGREMGIPPKFSDEAGYQTLKETLSKDFNFFCLYLSDMDKAGHTLGPNSKEITPKILEADQLIHKAVSLFQSKYPGGKIVIFSDHGMEECNQYVDVLKELNKLNYQRNKDYFMFLDSTMVRFLAEKKKCKQAIITTMKKLPHTKKIEDSTLKKEGISFKNNKYGNLTYATTSKAIILPNYFQTSKPKGMHGYQDITKNLFGFFIQNSKLTKKQISNTDVYNILKKEIIA